MDSNDVDTFEKLIVQLQSVYDEISLLSKKSPTDAVNKFKLKFINNLLNKANDFLGDSYVPFEDFRTFNDDDIPTNSDTVFVLAQYLQCFEKLRADNSFVHVGFWYWRLVPTKDQIEAPKIRTVQPKKLRS